MKINAFVHQNLLGIAVKVALIDGMLFDFYEVHLLSTPHKTNPMTFSYIEPSKPYIFLSITGTAYMKQVLLEHCMESIEWLCSNITTTKRIDRHHTKSCQVKCIQANTEICHKLSNNQWIFIINIVFKKKEPREDIVTDLDTHSLEENCKAYIHFSILTTHRRRFCKS